MRVAVTGASGHLGNVVCRFLIEKGFEVNALYNSDTRALEGLNVDLIKANILVPEDLNRAFTGCEMVINCAGIITIHGDPKGIVFNTNTEGPKNVINAAIVSGVKKIVHISSTHAINEKPLDRPMTEERSYKTEKNFAYDYSKARGEQIMLEAFKSRRIEGCVIRPSSLIGPFDYKPSELGKALLDFKNEKVPVLPPGGYDFLDVRDAAESIVRALEKGRNGEVYMVTGNYYSIKEFAKDVQAVTKSKVPKIVLPFWFMRMILPLVILCGKLKGAAPLFTKESILVLKKGHPNMDNAKAREELNHRVRPLVETFADYYNWHDRIIEERRN